MSEPFGRLRRFLRELKRRKVYRVAAVYAGVAFVVVQAANLVFPALNIPSWAYSLVVVLALLGFPLALVLAWAFEVTPEGVRRTPEAESAEDGRAPEGGTRTGYRVLLGLGLIAGAVAGGWYLTGGGEGGQTAARLGDRSIAVLPFEALGQEEPGTFTAGMHDDLLARLSNVSDLRVISRTAVEQYRDSDKTTGEIARELGVRWVLEGGVQEMGNQIQVNAQLIDPRTETHSWAETYQRDLTAQDLFDLQGEITRRIARSLEAQLTPEESERVERRPTEDLDAYRLYVQGRQRLERRTGESIREAIGYFQRAIARDSGYALAWSGLADARALFPNYGEGSLADSIPAQEEAARRALKIGPELAEAHASMGQVYMDRLSAPAALRAFHRAVDLKPSYAQAHHWLGWLQIQIGRLKTGQEHLSLAVELNPQNEGAQSAFVGSLIAQRKLERARRHVQRSMPDPQGLQGDILYHDRRWKELEALVREQLEAGSGRVASHWRIKLARIAALRGDTAAARQQLAELREAESYDSAGFVHAALGEVDEAFAAWSRKETWSGPPLVALRYFYSDILNSVRDDPRYEQLIREINVDWGLNPDGSLPDSVDVSFGAESDE